MNYDVVFGGIICGAVFYLKPRSIVACFAYRSGNMLSKEVKQLETSNRNNALKRLRHVETVGFYKRLELRYVPFCAKLARLIRFSTVPEATPK